MFRNLVVLPVFLCTRNLCFIDHDKNKKKKDAAKRLCRRIKFSRSLTVFVGKTGFWIMYTFIHHEGSKSTVKNKIKIKTDNQIDVYC